MKISWGWGIGIFYVIFMLSILSVVFYSTFHKQDLVVENYYEEDLAYQVQIDKIIRTKALKEKPKMSLKKPDLTIEFPESIVELKPEGKINFFRPSNKGQDKEFDLELDNNRQQIISVNEFQKGYWKVQINWMMNDSSYFVEKKFYF